MRARPVCWMFALLAVVAPRGPGTADDDPDAWLEMARRARPSIVRIEWRPRAGRGEPVERHAVIVDPDGWLLMAGPPTRPGTMAATLSDGRSMSARVHATDPATGLTLLRVPVRHLPALGIHDTPARRPDGSPRPVPHRAPPGTSVAMVTAEGAVARGQIRANHRQRWMMDPLIGAPRPLTCLDEAALPVLARDLGAPWLDAQGRILGLLVGARVPETPTAAAGEEEVRLRPTIDTAFAVPARVLEIVWPLLRDHAEVDRSLLGIRTRPLDDALAAHVCPDCGGRVVVEVAPDGPGARAGLRDGDILRGLGGAPLAQDVFLSDALLPYRPGQEVLVSVLRQGVATDLVVRLGAAR